MINKSFVWRILPLSQKFRTINFIGTVYMMKQHVHGFSRSSGFISSNDTLAMGNAVRSACHHGFES